MRYRYSAVDRQGKKQRGWIDAPSRRLACQALQEKNLQVLTVRPAGEAAGKSFLGYRPALRGNELAIFTRQLATLLSAALPLEDALLTLSQQCEKAAQQKLVQQLRQQVLEGRAFSEALRSHSKTFNGMYCAVAAAGESSGKLSLVLSRLADHTEQSQKIKNKLLQALLYPLLLTLIALGVITILLTSVVPKVVEQFIYFKAELPATTRILLALSEAVQTWGLPFLIICSASGLLARQLLKHTEYRRRFDRFLLNLPLAGKISLNLNIAHYAKTLSILSASAVPLLEAMHISAFVVSNSYARLQLIHAQEKVREGAELSHALTKSDLFSPMMRHMIASGERSGELDNMLGRAAAIQEETFLNQVTTMVSLFTPLLIMTMAGMVFFIVLAILQPIMQMNSLAG